MMCYRKHLEGKYISDREKKVDEYWEILNNKDAKNNSYICLAEPV